MDLDELTAIASREMAKHGLHGWRFGFSNTKRQLGVCKHRSKRIEISAFYAANSPTESVMDTLLHEIAHALAGVAAGHGPVWKAIALRLGAIPRACETTHQAVVQPGDWQATCPSCKKIFHRYKAPKSLTGYSCRCPSHSPLTFEFKGDPARKPVVPQTIQQSANWEAKCTGCGISHFRFRRPKAGVWRCRCAHRSELTWRYRSEKV